MVDAISLKNNDAKLNTQKEAPKISLDADNLAELLSKGKTTSKSGESLQINGDLNSLYEDMGLGFKRNVGNDANGQEVKLCAFTGEKRAGQSSQKASVCQFQHTEGGDRKISDLMKEVVPGSYRTDADGNKTPVRKGEMLLGMASTFAPHKNITKESTVDESGNALIEASVEYIILHPGPIQTGQIMSNETAQRVKERIKERIQMYLTKHGYASEEEAREDLIRKGVDKVNRCVYPFAMFESVGSGQ